MCAGSGAGPAPASYETQNPQWETLLDLDALGEERRSQLGLEGRELRLLPPGERCMVQLSNGGKDASVLREFDLAGVSS